MPRRAERFYITGGTLPRDASSYVERTGDADVIGGLRSGQFCYVLTSRQMGKSSLMVHTVAQLREEGILCAVIDLTAIGQNLDPVQWYGGIINRLAEQLALEEELEEFWFSHSDVSPLLRLMRAMREVVLHHRKERIVLFIDEIDSVRSLPFSADEFFAAIRYCYNQRTEDEEYERLAFCLLGVASPSDLIRDARTTPFNIGKRIDLTDFTLKEAKSLARGMPQKFADVLLERILYWTGGHPYLTQRLCAAVTADEATGVRDVDRVCHDVFLSSEALVQNDNLLFVRDRVLRSDLDVVSILELYKQAITGREVRSSEDNPLVSELRLAGLVRDDHGSLTPRNRIYSAVFNLAWIERSLPSDEVRRQKAAYRRGVIRVATLASALVSAFGILALYAFGQRNNALDLAAQSRSIARAERMARADADASAKARSKALILANDARIKADAKTKEADRQKKIAEKNLSLADDRLVKMNAANTQKGVALKTAQVQRDRAERFVYFANMNLLQREFEGENMEHVFALLRETQTSKSRGFEWEYWYRRCHSDLLTMHLSTAGTKQIKWSANQIPFGFKDVEGQHRIQAYMTVRLEWDSVFFAPDGSMVVGLSNKQATIQGVGAPGPSLTINRKAHIRHAAFSPDLKRLVTGEDDGSAHVLDRRSGREVLTLSGHTGAVTGVAYSPNGSQILTFGMDRQIKIWNASTGKELRTITGDNGIISLVEYSPDNKHIFTLEYDHIVRSLDSISYKVEFSREVHDCISMAVFPGGKRLALGFRNGKIEIVDASSGKMLFAMRGNKAATGSVAAFADDRRLISLADDGEIKIWDCGISPDPIIPFLESLFLRWPVPRWTNTKAGPSKSASLVKSRLSYTGIKTPINKESFSPDGTHMVTNFSDNTARVRNSHNYREELVLRGHHGIVERAEFSPDGSRIATASWDQTAKLWNARTGQAIKTFVGHHEKVCAVAFSPDGTRIATGDYLGSVREWDVSTGKQLLELRGIHNQCHSVAFSPDGKRIVACELSQIAKVWDANTGKALLNLVGHDGNVSSVTYSPDGTRILTSTDDRVMTVWDAETGTETLHLSIPGYYFSGAPIEFSRDRRRLMVIGKDAYRTMWFAKAN